MFGPKATASKTVCGYYKSKTGQQHPTCSGVGTHPQPCPGRLPLCTIGREMLGMFNEVKGQGLTWAEAFARAEISKHYDECRRCLFRSKMKCKQLRLLREKADGIRNKELARRGLWQSIKEA